MHSGDWFSALFGFVRARLERWPAAFLGMQGWPRSPLLTLLTTWVLATGRTPPAGRPDDLSAEELIDFWADDRT
ncbi:hypothetical protein FH608_039430 [Nonomuraea phyllanthi]|uniref:Uncharacterized protein n=1 Tax=Nonomuraea phyllanthi TaxID=2219224 RepID=A0A5C4VPL4_9ACTN|nr:hypothetical protein [Nonomuraea phyllanthi]KAB8189658.1 hypothetical protein FH608_039430 [Nonomuraea phyllanthi]QFY11989.1 hypothetical protein GBF35_40305 [Nonomuraea phyllanthi]